MTSTIIFISGSGSNLQEIMDLNEKGILSLDIQAVISNKKAAFGLERAKKHNIPTFYFPYFRKKITREEYETQIVSLLDKLQPSLIILAGWMHIWTPVFCDKYGSITLNLHPAYPGMFPGAHGIDDAFASYQSGKTDYAGIMGHKVVEEIDAGEVLSCMKVPIYQNDKLEDVSTRVKYHEKSILINAIQHFLAELPREVKKNNFHPLHREGKVRQVKVIAPGVIQLTQSDRLSSFDRQICDIPNKGQHLTQIAAWWFQHTLDIIPNHYLAHFTNLMWAKRTTVIPLEIVVRKYLTGSTQTSIWSRYQKGERQFGDLILADNLSKNSPLPHPIITPTTKGKSDLPITEEEIINLKYLTSEEWEYLKEKSLALFARGEEVANKMGLILVDTKYEFGRDKNNNLILIDELHTCDSSRYWVHQDDLTHPQRLDKDLIREWVASQIDPYTDPIPDIPSDLKLQVEQAYQHFSQSLQTVSTTDKHSETS